jgi:hypothetical protein
MYSMYPIWDGRRLAVMVDGLRGVVAGRGARFCELFDETLSREKRKSEPRENAKFGAFWNRSQNLIEGTINHM